MIANGQTLTTSTWLSVLKILNPKLRVCSFENSNRLAGLYLVNKQGKWEDICGVDKNYVPAYTTFDDGGHVVKSGYRRVIWILLAHNYTSCDTVRRAIPGFFDGRACSSDRFVGGIAGDPITNKFNKYALEAAQKGEETITKDQILEVGKDVEAKDTPQQREDREKDRWFLETWKKNGGGVNDRPNY